MFAVLVILALTSWCAGSLYAGGELLDRIPRPRNDNQYAAAVVVTIGIWFAGLWAILGYAAS